ncbi:MAG: hypothetical protein IJW21_07890, partial [Clostridia bacterium]|nr:hypothetical protein [Clostridia bacterium]
ASLRFYSIPRQAKMQVLRILRLIFYDKRKIYFSEQKPLMRFLKFILFNFFGYEKVAKSKNLAGLTLLASVWRGTLRGAAAKKIFTRTSQKFFRRTPLRIKCGLPSETARRSAARSLSHMRNISMRTS